MREAYFSKNRQARAAYVERVIQTSGKPVVIYLYPQNRAKILHRPQTTAYVHYISYEEMLKTDKWLEINGILGDDSLLILDTVSRYSRVSSSKALSIGRLAGAGAKAIVDIAPFVYGVQHLFHSMSLLGNDILGYASYHAWCEGYQEVSEDGTVKSAHDFGLVAKKISQLTKIDYSEFQQTDRTVVRFSSEASELQRYADLKAKIFAEDRFEPQPAITRLADLAHAFDSRIQVLIELAGSLSGSTLLYTNLKSYAAKAIAACKKAGLTHVSGTSYQLGSHSQDFDNIIYLESPIVNRHFFLEAEANIKEGAKVFHLLGDTNVDRYLYAEAAKRLTEINEFTRELHHAVTGHPIPPQTVPKEKCLAGSAGAHQLGLF